MAKALDRKAMLKLERAGRHPGSAKNIKDGTGEGTEFFKLRAAKKPSPRTALARSVDKTGKDLAQRDEALTERENALQAYMDGDPEAREIPRGVRGTLLSRVKTETEIIEWVTFPGRPGVFKLVKKA